MIEDFIIHGGWRVWLVAAYLASRLGLACRPVLATSIWKTAQAAIAFHARGSVRERARLLARNSQ